jgi:hypothetical protein
LGLPTTLSIVVAYGFARLAWFWLICLLLLDFLATTEAFPLSSMAFSILDHIEKLEPSDHPGKYICPACGGNDLSINTSNGAYNCFNDDSPKHRAEIRNIIAPLDRWERPLREPQSYTFAYKNRQGETTINVHRDDASGKKTIKQSYPSVPQGAHQRKAYVDEIRSSVLPYRFDEALTASQVTGLPIFIVEGELTCDRLWEIGIPSVTFLGGSKQYRANGDYSLLFRGKKIVLCPDRDEPGVALMREVASDNPGAQWLYAEPDSFEWDSLPQNGGYDLADWLDDGADQELILSSIVSKDRHEGKDGLPSYEEIIGNFERMVGLFDNEARVAFEASKWLEAHGVKMPQANIDKMIDEARARLFGKEEIETIDVLQLIDDDSVREWLIAGIVPLGSVTLLAAQGGTGKTSLVYNWALGVATGSSWSGRRCLPGKCLLISADEPLSDTKEKLSIIGYQEANIQPGMISFWETWRFAHIQQLERFIKKHRPVFVVIDSLTACFAGMNVDLIKSNAGDSLYALRDMANVYKCSIVILHHLNRQGGLRDSSSFVDNVSEVVKLYRQEGNFDQNQFILEWVKSRSGLAGKHVLKRNAVNYGWDYAGPLGNSIAELDRVANYVNMRPHERFSKQQVSLGTGMNENVTTGKLLEMARRQGLITSSFIVGPHDERTRMYHSWDYQGPDLDFSSPNAGQAVVPEREEPMPKSNEIVPAKESLPDGEDENDWF